MRSTLRLLQHKIDITLFTRRNCSLCEDAKSVLAAVRVKKDYHYSEIDVMASGQEAWKVYEFDTPVIHVSRLCSAPQDGGQQSIARECGKLMHRFTEDQVLRLIDEIETA